jgi:hypothetical protein
MKRDIHKLADWLVEVCQEGVVIEQKILEWKRAEKTPVTPQPKVG